MQALAVPLFNIEMGGLRQPNCLGLPVCIAGDQFVVAARVLLH